MFIGQSKIYSYLNPSKTPGARPPLQEENSVMYHEVKCQGKTLNKTCRKGNGKIDFFFLIAHPVKCAPSTPPIGKLKRAVKKATQLPWPNCFPSPTSLPANWDSTKMNLSLSFSELRSGVYQAIFLLSFVWLCLYCLSGCKKVMIALSICPNLQFYHYSAASRQCLAAYPYFLVCFIT